MGGSSLAPVRAPVDVFDLAGTGMVIVDANCLIRRANSAYCALIGRNESELIGEPFANAFPKSTQPLARRALKAALGPGALPMPSYWTLMRRDGSSAAVLLSIRTAPAGPPLAVVTATDVSALARAETRLISALGDQRLILDHAQVGIAYVRSGRVVRANATAARMMHCAGELNGQAIADIMRIADETGKHGDAPLPSVTNRESWHAEVLIRRKDGSAFWCEIDAQPFGTPAEPPQAIWTLRDVTARRHAQDDLTRTTRDQQVLFDRASVGILYIRDHRIERCNRKAEALFGYPPGKLVGSSTATLLPDSAGFEAAAVAATGKDLTYETEHPCRRSDGTSALLRISGRALNPSDVTQGVIWIIQDVTAQHTMQEQLLQSRGELERRIAARTRVLAWKNAQLEAEITERRSAEESLRVRGERLLFHRDQLLALARRDRSDFETAMREILASTCGTLRLDRVSYWEMPPDHSRVQCRFVHRADRGLDTPLAVDTLDGAMHPAYFNAVLANEIIAAEDAESHPATASLAASYLRPLGIAAMLVAPVWLDGVAVGMVSCEVTRWTRPWLLEETEFVSGIATMIALAIEASQRREAEGKLLRLAHYDALTGLPNRTLLADRLRQALAHAARHGGHVALIFLDLDQFKAINDSLGHHMGDRLLREVGSRLTRTLRGEDTVARLGGDEFVVVLQDVQRPAHVATVAQNLLRELSAPYALDGRELAIAASMGITLYPDDGRDAEMLMKNADVAMYHVKESGRNGYAFFDASMNHQVNRRLTIENDLRLAIRHNDLVLHYQPQLHLPHREVRAVEALVRWRHPTQGLLMPADFIGIAEESGLASALDQWALHEACSQIGRWRTAGVATAPVAVNISARAFRNDGLVAQLGTILHETGLGPGLLELEIPESVVMQPSSTAAAILAELSHMGIRFAVDRFGSGSASLAALKRLPINKLKIDPTLVHDVPGNSDDAAITHALIAAAKSLELEIVAAGVESEAQLRFLATHGCDDVQGYLFSPPCEARETERIFGPTGTSGAGVTRI